ncbi:MAG: hypothetical protein H6838_04310 [Planctomycetes bacterium]|nr:hypothetical protein [Planctomycetota bacterium]MCB9884689.1 hypothetical protein [Planctomycetota bacterium]
MSRVQVKKVVAVLFLESAKLTLDHIAEYRLELSNSGVTGAPDLPRIYGELRRLRDYLQRCLSGHQESVALEISPPDCALLVACCRRMYEWLDQRIVSEQIMSPDEKALVQRKRQVLGDWSVELAEKPLVELPIPGIGKTQSEAVRALRTRISNKLFKQRVIPGVGQQGPRGPQMSAGVSLMGDMQVAQPDPFALPDVGMASTQARPPAQSESTSFSASQLIDATKLRDPRLRSLVQVDLRSFDRAIESKDYRIATVLLGCVLESVMLDFVIQKRTELGIGGGPETWNLSELLIKAMGSAFTPHDRSSAFHLFAARNLLRPALQITTPTVVTAATLQKLQEFVHRAFRSLGFTSTAQGTPAAGDADPYSMYGLRFDED